ncbi:polyketide cyclase / dehydrase [Aureococcus anophagefferens]|nr:polyketide cyclase / dehydrase [Aureococcus anophagefferens]
MHAISALLLLAGPGAALIAQRPAPRQRHCNTLAATTADKKATRETRRQIKARKKASPTSSATTSASSPARSSCAWAAPGNARRIYTGVDISADVDTVWDLLTDYEGLADVVPNLVANEVIAKPPGGGGAALRQASMVLDVAEVRGGLAAGQIRRGELDRVDAATEDGIRATEKKERLGAASDAEALGAALKSVDLDVRPGPNGDAVDTIVARVAVEAPIKAEMLGGASVVWKFPIFAHAAGGGAGGAGPAFLDRSTLDLIGGTRCSSGSSTTSPRSGRAAQAERDGGLAPATVQVGASWLQVTEALGMALAPSTADAAKRAPRTCRPGS